MFSHLNVAIFTQLYPLLASASYGYTYSLAEEAFLFC